MWMIVNLASRTQSKQASKQTNTSALTGEMPVHLRGRVGSSVAWCRSNDLVQGEKSCKSG